MKAFITNTTDQPITVKLPPFFVDDVLFQSDASMLLPAVNAEWIAKIRESLPAGVTLEIADETKLQ